MLENLEKLFSLKSLNIFFSCWIPPNSFRANKVRILTFYSVRVYLHATTNVLLVERVLIFFVPPCRTFEHGEYRGPGYGSRVVVVEAYFAAKTWSIRWICAGTFPNVSGKETKSVVPVMPDKFQVFPVRFEAKTERPAVLKARSRMRSCPAMHAEDVSSTPSDVVWKDNDTEGTFWGLSQEPRRAAQQRLGPMSPSILCLQWGPGSSNHLEVKVAPDRGQLGACCSSPTAPFQWNCWRLSSYLCATAVIWLCGRQMALFRIPRSPLLIKRWL